MDDRIRKLQVRVRVLHRGHVTSQARYPDDLRAEVAAVTRAAKAAGRAVYSLAREIGVSAPTLIEWSRRPAPTLAFGHARAAAGPRDRYVCEPGARNAQRPGQVRALLDN